MDSEPVIMYADYVCPFCYVGQAVLRDVLSDRDDPPPVAWRPFDLRGSRRDATGAIVVEERMDEAYFERAWRNVTRLAAEYDVDPPHQASRAIDSRLAQTLSLTVRDRAAEHWDALDRALYCAHWIEERDIGDPEVLATIATEVGIREPIIDEALTSDGSALSDAFASARRDGITGVPMFRYDGQAIRGAASPERLSAVLA